MKNKVGKSRSCGILKFMQIKVDDFVAHGRLGTASTYKSTLKSFSNFLDGKDVRIGRMDASLMERYEAWLQGRNLVRNTTSFYLRTLRTIYKQALDMGMTDGVDIFRHVYTGFDRTPKRAVSLQDIRAIRDINLNGNRVMEFARDMFMFSFYMRGMPFVDMAYLKKSDLIGDRVVYFRKKTKQRLEVSWEPQMQEIIDKYVDVTDGRPYMLPIITSDDIPERQQYLRAERSVNRNLKRIANILKMNIPLTTYVARHTWASSAYRLNIPISVISECMGHDSEKTTQIYLASLDNATISMANRRILDKISYSRT